MIPYIYIATFLLTFLLESCNGQVDHDSPNSSLQDSLTQSKETSVKNNPVDYVKNYNGEDNQLFVFVGHKILVENLPYKEGSMDEGFKAKYKILQKVFGNFSQDTIEFVVYDHYGIPAFSKFEDVLLFVSADSGTYFHQKYMYNDVYKTKDGRWAGSYAIKDYKHGNNKKIKIKPIKIGFQIPVIYPLKEIRGNGDTIQLSYPKPYFKTIDNGAIVVYGNYVEELFILKRDGFLTARNIFHNGELRSNR
ncbi:MAG: hypothetical protein KF862_27145 [Chitinophagaceae bacterium]|nr:hypothetical protein [Chitinophagaceae bacterium]